MTTAPSEAYEYIYEDAEGNEYYQVEDPNEDPYQYSDDAIKDAEFTEDYLGDEFEESYIYDSPIQAIEPDGNQQFTVEESDSHIDEVINIVAHGNSKSEAEKTSGGLTTKICEFCGIFLKYPSKIKAHMRTHTGERPYSCVYCHQTFTQRTPWQSHLKRHTGDTPHTCSFCSKAFPLKSICVAHENRVHMKKQTPSEFVAMVFEEPSPSTSQKLPDMVEITTTRIVKKGSTEVEKEIKIYVCQICGQNLRYPSKIERHMLGHISYKYKPFQCEYCSILLSSSSTYKVHIQRFHSTERPFECRWQEQILSKENLTKCLKKFPNESTRNEHEKIVHHKLKRYQCSINDCNKLFTRRPYLDQHFSKCHADWSDIPENMKGYRVVAIPCKEGNEKMMLETRNPEASTFITQECGTKYYVEIIGALGQQIFRNSYVLEEECINVYSENFDDDELDSPPVLEAERDFVMEGESENE